MGDLIPIKTFCSATIHALNLTEDFYTQENLCPICPQFKTGLIENSML